MKNAKNIFATLTLILLFSIVSCQKEDMNETAFINEDSFSSAKISNVECIDFQTPLLYAGEIPSEIYTNVGGRPINVYGVNPSFRGTNAAMIFDSYFPTGNDFDLGSPNQVFGGPGIGEAGAVEPYVNKQKLGKILIISNDLNDGNPNDLESIGRLKFDFSDWGFFKLHSITVIDVEGKYGSPNIELYGANSNLLATLDLPVTGDNGVKTEYFDRSIGSIEGAVKMVVNLYGSGGIDNICIERVSPSEKCVNDLSYWEMHAGFGPYMDEVSPLLPIAIGKPGGLKSFTVHDRYNARDIFGLDYFGGPENGFAALYAELLVTKLNVAKGVNSGSANKLIGETDLLLSRVGYKDWETMERVERENIVQRTKMLREFNIGKLEIPLCEFLHY